MSEKEYTPPNPEPKKKGEITEQDCEKWKKSPRLNPKTGKRLYYAKKPYNRYLERCGSPDQDKLNRVKKSPSKNKKPSKENEKELCQQWVQEGMPPVNPFTKRKIGKEKRTYKTLLKRCEQSPVVSPKTSPKTPKVKEKVIPKVKTPVKKSPPKTKEKKKTQAQELLENKLSRHLFVNIDIGSLRGVENIVRNGAKVNKKDENGRLPLNFAISKKNLEIVKYLVQTGASLEPDEDGWTPLHYAVRGGDLSIVKFLVGAGADLEAKSPGGLTPLHYAAYEGRLPIVEYLLREGANYSSRTRSGETPKSLARQRKHDDVVNLLQSYEDGSNLKIAVPPTARETFKPKSRLRPSSS